MSGCSWFLGRSEHTHGTGAQQEDSVGFEPTTSQNLCVSRCRLYHWTISYSYSLTACHTLMKTVTNERRNAVSDYILFVKCIRWAFGWKLKMTKFNKWQMTNAPHTAIWFDAFNHCTLVNRILCKACQQLAEVEKQTSLWAAICSFIHLLIYPSHSSVCCCFHKHVTGLLEVVRGSQWWHDLTVLYQSFDHQHSKRRA